MGYNEIFTAINLIILTIALYLTLKKNKVEESLSNSEEHLNWKQLYTESMDEVRRVLQENKEIKKENAEIKDMLKKSHVEVILDIPIGGAPTVKRFEWKQLIETK